MRCVVSDLLTEMTVTINSNAEDLCQISTFPKNLKT